MNVTYVLWGALTVAIGIIGKFFWDKISALEKQIDKLDGKVESLEEENKNIIKNYKDRFEEVKRVSSDENEKTRVMITDLNVKILERLSSIDVAIANITKS